MDMVEFELKAMQKRNEELMMKIIIESKRLALEEKELPIEIKQSLTSFQSLVNHLLERSLRMFIFFYYKL